MSQAAEFVGTIKDGRFSQGAEIRELLKYWDGERIKITMEPYERQRTNALNDFWFGFHIEPLKTFLEEASGEKYTLDDVHQWWKMELGYFRTFKGERIPLSSRKFSTKKFLEMVDKSIARTAPMGLVLPLFCEHMWPTDATEHPAIASSV